MIMRNIGSMIVIMVVLATLFAFVGCSSKVQTGDEEGVSILGDATRHFVSRSDDGAPVESAYSDCYTKCRSGGGSPGTCRSICIERHPKKQLG